MWGRLPEQLTCILNEDEATPYATFPHLPPSPHFQKEPFVFFRCSLATPITTPSHQKINKTSIIHHIISESFWIYIYIRYVYIYLYTLNILFHNISVVNFLALLPEAFRFAFLMASHQDFWFEPQYQHSRVDPWFDQAEVDGLFHGYDFFM